MKFKKCIDNIIYFVYNEYIERRKTNGRNYKSNQQDEKHSKGF